jgi:hydrogenase maturation protein HypF
MAHKSVDTLEAASFRVRGVVQGVGFRPFVYRLARKLRLAGWVRNDADGVLIHAEGPPRQVERFEKLLIRKTPAQVRIASVTRDVAFPEGHRRFRITTSAGDTSRIEQVRVPLDRAACAVCVREVFDRDDRHYDYPLTTCTECGPRYSIIRRLPYDRPQTSMASFPLCRACDAEYGNPDRRRFHAQPIACPKCGPQVALWDDRGAPCGHGPEVIRVAADLLHKGRIVALKGLGGFQLVVRADRSDCVARLHACKHRPTKPLAAMVRSLAEAEHLARISVTERCLLTSAENPIVLLDRLPGTAEQLVPEIAPRLNSVGLLLPTTPLHHLLLAELPFPVVATSGNRGSEPIVLDEHAAVRELAGNADAFLVHDRPILRRVDDSVMRVCGERPMAMRLARGYAPLSLPAIERLARSAPPLLATGPQQKAALALWSGSQAVLSPHIGDLDSLAMRAAWRSLAGELRDLYGCEIAAVACDQHPDYFTTGWAAQMRKPVIAVQHHHAHAVACMAEHDLLDREVLAFTWDGTGYGPDGTVWGGEALRADVRAYRRIASLRPFPLPGNEAAIRQPARVALALCAEALTGKPVCEDMDLLKRLGLSPSIARVLLQMVERGINTPRTSSVGRLFDAVAALVLGASEVSYEGEAAIWLEAIVDPNVEEAYPMPVTIDDPGVSRADWRPLIAGVLDDLSGDTARSVIAARFHNALVEWATQVAAAEPCADVVLSGGCFQNRWLVVRLREALEKLGWRVYTHGLIPPGDGGLAAGQLASGAAILAGGVGERWEK